MVTVMITCAIIIIAVVDLCISLKKADEAKERYDQYFSKTYWLDKETEARFWNRGF